MGEPDRTSADRRWVSRVVQMPGEDGCWFWVGAITTTGYGRFWLDGRAVAAHREAWRRAHGTEPPAGMVVRHTCDETSCVRPSHLLLGTLSENSQDLVRRGRWAGPHRGGTGGDTRGPAGRARAIREVLLTTGPDPDALDAVLRAGDPQAAQTSLF